jgi:TPR repeat protein
MYDHGAGVAEDRSAAAAWYRKAAEAGEALAQNNLGDMYSHGDGVPLDYAQAFFWFQKAAEQGHTGAEIVLAHMYAQGRGTAADPEAAYAWVMAASLAGDLRGQELISVLQARLGRGEIARAEDRARELLLVAETNPPRIALLP